MVLHIKPRGQQAPRRRTEHRRASETEEKGLEHKREQEKLEEEQEDQEEQEEGGAATWRTGQRCLREECQGSPRRRQRCLEAAGRRG